ncbi:uncharacterized protein LOC131332082 [Rhododendron vialii]|uniref:uncharacterized protein LOC131332082 n=1 Tax=Rhododendron vialii TaxID=182163 RepID=UPI002660200F|nr:uncharacterized protein LOC131332082 [Rhododendron vialii]
MAKQSNPFSQRSDFSLLIASHSQVLAALDSLSNLSEPPDIRNRFSSYAYESPELNSDLQGYGFGESGCVEEGIDGEEKTKGNDETFGRFQKIRNKDGLVLVEKAASIGFVKSNNPTGDYDHRIKNASQLADSTPTAREPLGPLEVCPGLIKVIGSSDSFSLSSEPPEITRWFASYVYESPAVDTSVAFTDSVSTESESERVPFNAEKCSKDKGEHLTEFTSTKRDVLAADKNTSSNGLVECNSYATGKSRFQQDNNEDTSSIEGNKMSSVQNELPVKMISGQEGKPTRYYDDCSTQTDEKSCFDYQVPIGKNNRKSPKKSTRRRDSREIRKPACGINNKENQGTTIAENGFVSTRNERRERVNHDSSLKNCLRNGVTDSLAVLRRKPLSETTNNNIQHADYLEITGKWQCPQKRKPNLGPPLKQLRLEQWVHRGQLAISLARVIYVRLNKDMGFALALGQDCWVQHMETKGCLEVCQNFS